MQVTGCRMGGQHFDVDEDKDPLLFSLTGLKFQHSLEFGPPFYRSCSSKLPWRRAKWLNNHHPIIVPNDSQCPDPHADCLVRSVLAQCILEWMPWFSHYVLNAVSIRDAWMRWMRWTGGDSICCLSVGCHRTCSFGTSKPVSGYISRSRWSTRTTKRWSAVSHATTG